MTISFEVLESLPDLVVAPEQQALSCEIPQGNSSISQLQVEIFRGQLFLVFMKPVVEAVFVDLGTWGHGDRGGMDLGLWI